ncbi:hypothetical protein CDAR_444381 [Caerostris darwini]|uniref:Uncharacterized protein n=1 Tax=Caerostris darwini TaxID=1538125 RepID=A0AAV4XB60_9ARAC|nr:hypothetical protein CDAR_444381 [Caerostris darwini]
MLRVSADAHFLGESRAIRDLPASPESVPLSIVGEGEVQEAIVALPWQFAGSTGHSLGDSSSETRFIDHRVGGSVLALMDAICFEWDLWCGLSKKLRAECIP